MSSRGGLTRNHHHSRFFPQKGTPLRRIEVTPSWTARGYPPHGQLEGIPLTDKKRLPPSRLPREALPPRKTTSSEAYPEPRAEPRAFTWRLEAHAPRDRTLYEARQPPRRLGNSKRGFLVGRKYFRPVPKHLSPTLPGNRCALMHFSTVFEPPRFASVH